MADRSAPSRTAAERRPPRAAEGARRAWAFAGTFLGIVGLLAAVRAAGLTDAAADAVAYGIAVAASLVVAAGRPDVALVDRTVVVTAAGSLRVTRECCGLDLVCLLGAAIAAFPVGWERRVIGLALLVPFVFLMNTLRVVSLALLLGHGGDLFDVCHTFVWPGVLVMASLAYWLAWWNASHRATAA